MAPHRNRLARVLLVVTLLLCSCGGEAPREPSAVLTWLALGGDVRDGDGARAAQTEVLHIGTSPRWFIGPAELVSEAEIRRCRAAQDIVVKEARIENDAPPGMRWRATVPVRPRSLSDIPLSQGGARLELRVAKGAAGGELALTLTLHAGERALFREREHRSTNVLPFLFTLAVNGRPVRVQPTGAAHSGSSARFERLVEAGASRRWSLRVDHASLHAFAASAVTIVAVFCERQHTGFAALEGEFPTPRQLSLPFDGEPVLIRSKAVAVPAGT